MKKLFFFDAFNLSFFILCFLVLILPSCIGGGKYYIPFDDFEPEEVENEAHYIYKDEGLVLAARIKNLTIYGRYGYQLIIINNRDEPLLLNWIYDEMSVKLEGEIIKLKKFSPVESYPNILDPDNYATLTFEVDSKYNKKINSIEELIFTFKSGEYIIEKNPKAKWE